ncbi:PILR alpha-associated neural protein [Eublepharis macularius]|uniref:PILR alpha-associated neural protein n=1 Tax=Eublepharis macularius TaxID=481883 RepID=A0AA97KIH1_EUBMA|nr:PILR alpha-associated neural protein [Eublepharis macularius]
METRSCTGMPPLVCCFHLLRMWPFLLLASAVPPHSAWSLRPQGLLAARPLCNLRRPSVPRSVCLWGKAPPPERGSRALSLRQRSPIPKGAERRGTMRLRRQAQGSRPATPSGFEDVQSSSQYPWAIVWGPTISVEDGGDPNSANPGLLPPLGYTFVSSSGMVTAQPNSHSLRHNKGFNLHQTPATLPPFLFGPRGEGVDPQLYVTITISVIIALVAMAIILKFCWDRNQKRRRHSSQQSGPQQQQGSQQPLTDLSPAAFSILGPCGDSQTPPPEMTEAGQVLEGLDKLEGMGKTSAFQLNRIPLVNL